MRFYKWLLALLVPLAVVAGAQSRTYPPATASAGVAGSSGPRANEYMPFSGHATLANGLTHYWTFDGTSSPWSDEIGTADLVQGAGGPYVTVAGVRGNALDLNSSPSTLSATDSSFAVTGDRTFSAWVKTTNGSYGNPASTLFQFFQFSPFEYNWRTEVQTPSPTIAQSHFYDTTGASVTGGTIVAPGTVWNNILFEYNASAKTTTMRFNNSTTNTSGALAGTIRTNGNTVYVQLWSNNIHIDEYGFWTRLLTAGERADLYNGGTGRFY